jgi:hypothetical protein
MSNFIKTFLKGKAGKNFGLTTGLAALDEAINGIQRTTSYGLAAAPKVGKTTLADFAFLLSPYLQALKLGIVNKVHWIYFSFEVDRISKEFKFAAFFMDYDYGINTFDYKGVTYNMNMNYLMGKQLHRFSDGTSELIPVTEEHENLLKQIYLNRIIPMFGEYDEGGNKIRDGVIDFIEDSENPTGLRNYLMKYARDRGTFNKVKYQAFNVETKQHEERERIVSYTPKPEEEDKFVIVITDHVRKLRRERGFTMKDNIDKWLEYTTWIRNMCGYIFVNICHSNRGLTNVDRLKYAGETIFPTADDVKDSGNLAEESTILMTMFNPNDEKYNIKKHFDIELESYPNYRSIHITESRTTECPVHIQVNMYGGINSFTSI